MTPRRPPTAGQRAERRAERYLRRRGYVTLARNLRVGHDELDLVLRDPDGMTIVLVEVKSSILGLVRARGALDRRKRRHLARVMRTLERLGILGDHPTRLDGVFVDDTRTPPHIEHLRGTTLAPQVEADPPSFPRKPNTRHPCQ